MFANFDEMLYTKMVYIFLIFKKCKNMYYRSATVNSKSFVDKVLLRIKWKFELINAL